jgi:hypothetical protein
MRTRVCLKSGTLGLGDKDRGSERKAWAEGAAIDRAALCEMASGANAEQICLMFIRSPIVNAVILSVLVAELFGAAVKLAGG